jgi:hypothetical protein
MVSYEFVLQKTMIALSCYRDAKAREASALMETHWRTVCSGLDGLVALGASSTGGIDSRMLSMAMLFQAEPVPSK